MTIINVKEVKEMQENYERTLDQLPYIKNVKDLLKLKQNLKGKYRIKMFWKNKQVTLKFIPVGK